MQAIHFGPSVVWDFFEANSDALLEESIVIAEDDRLDVEIHLGAYSELGLELPVITVIHAGGVLCEEHALNEQDCEMLVREIYYDYLNEPRLAAAVAAKEYDEEDGISVVIDDNESHLDDVVADFFYDLLGQPLEEVCRDSDEIIEDCKDHFLEYISDKWGVPVYRPSLVNEDGRYFLKLYPYEDETDEYEYTPAHLAY